MHTQQNITPLKWQNSEWFYNKHMFFYFTVNNLYFYFPLLAISLCQPDHPTSSDSGKNRLHLTVWVDLWTHRFLMRELFLWPPLPHPFPDKQQAWSQATERLTPFTPVPQNFCPTLHLFSIRPNKNGSKSSSREAEDFKPLDKLLK